MNNEFAISTASSLIAYSLTYPIDSIKTNYQIASYKSHRPNVLNVVKNIYDTKGILGYYRGISSTLMTYPLFWGVFFQVYSQSNVMIASTVASLVTNPLFVMKVRFQTAISNGVNVSYYSLMKDIYQIEGSRGFFKGFGSSIINNTKLWIQFPLYDQIKSKTDNVILASIGSKIISSTLYYPTDLIRTNQRFSKERLKVIPAIRQMYNMNGIRGFYNGVILYNMISIPSFVVLMVIRDLIKN